MLAGDGENGFAFGIPGNLDNCLARIDDPGPPRLFATR
jgi:hypothetical protein